MFDSNIYMPKGDVLRSGPVELDLPDMEMPPDESDAPAEVLDSSPKPRQITPRNPQDPADIGYPATLPIELALRTSSVRQTCQAYGITEEEWDLIRHEPLFREELARAKELVAKEGMSFKIKARLQAEELLKTAWGIIHNPTTPPNVKADLIKSTVRWSGYDAQAASAGSSESGFSISINFNGDQKGRIIDV